MRFMTSRQRYSPRRSGMHTNIMATLKREIDCDDRAGLDLPGVCECEVRNESDSILGRRDGILRWDN